MWMLLMYMVFMQYPKLFLVDPEGIVVAKDLRSKKLEKTLFNLLE